MWVIVVCLFFQQCLFCFACEVYLHGASSSLQVSVTLYVHFHMIIHIYITPVLQDILYFMFLVQSDTTLVQMLFDQGYSDQCISKAFNVVVVDV